MDLHTLIRRSTAGSFFVEITRDERLVEVVEGRVGTDGDSETRSFSDADAARTFVEQQLARRRAEGFTEASDVPKTDLGKENPDLEAALITEPDNPAAYLVYADWLQAHGDPRGELVVVQEQLQRCPKPQLERLERALLADFGEYFWGELWPYRDDVKLGWQLGFIRSASLLPDPGRQPLAPIVRALLAAPSARLLRELSLAYCAAWEGQEYEEAVDAIVAGGQRPLLRSLDIGRQSQRMDDERIGSLSQLWPLLPSLEKLRLCGTGVEFGGVPLHHLTTLRLICDDAADHPLVTLGQGSWPKLETLQLGTEGVLEIEEQAVALTRLLQPRRLPALTELRLHGAMSTIEILEAICSSGLLAKLHTLDLSRGNLGPKSAELLLGRRSEMVGMKHLDVAGSGVPALEREALGALGSFVRTELSEEEEYFDDELYDFDVHSRDVLDLDGPPEEYDQYDLLDVEDVAGSSDSLLTEYCDDPGDAEDSARDFRAHALELGDEWSEPEN